jgi:protein-disulfide isomerase
MSPRKNETIAPVIAPEDQFAVNEKDTFTFKRSHFYAVLTVLAFAAGVLLGYVVWGYNTQPTTFVVQAAVSPTPEPLVYDIETAGYPSLGPADAPVVIVEFSDYQCPYCYRWYVQVFKPLLETYKDKVRFVYRNYPLSFHQNALAAAEAALCAGDQDAYWTFHNTLFDHNATLNSQDGNPLDQSTYIRYAADLGLDTTKFKECMNSHKYQQFIQDDMNYANGLPPDTSGEPAVGGTPTFFINGHRLGGAYPLQSFKEIIDAELAKSK